MAKSSSPVCKFQFVVLLKLHAIGFPVVKWQRTISRCTYLITNRKGEPQKRKRAPGGVWGGGSPCGSKALNSLPSRILWVLSWRDKKVPPTAGTSTTDHMKADRLNEPSYGPSRTPVHTFPHPSRLAPYHLPLGEGLDKLEIKEHTKKPALGFPTQAFCLLCYFSFLVKAMAATQQTSSR